MNNKHVAFLGLGAMGLPMAASLVRSGFRTVGFDVRSEARAAFTQHGGEAASSAAGAMRDADVIVLVVFDIAQAEHVLFENGALQGTHKDALVILCSTSPPKAVAELAARVEATGRSFLDSPVSGGKVGAENASLSIMAAGSQHAFEAGADVLRAMGDKISHVGLVCGQAALMKTINQLLCGVHIAAAAEALSLAEKAGIDSGAAFDVVSRSAASSWMLNDRGPRMMQSQPEVASSVDIFTKDLAIVVAAGREFHAAIPLAETALRLFNQAAAMNFGKQDDSPVVQVYRYAASDTPDARSTTSEITQV